MLCEKQKLTTLWASSCSKHAVMEAQGFSFRGLNKCSNKIVFNERVKLSSWSIGKKWVQDNSVSVPVTSYRALLPSSSHQQCSTSWVFSFSYEFFELTQVHGGTRTPSWKKPFTPIKREEQHALSILLDLNLFDSMCTCMLEHPTLEMTNAFVISATECKYL